MKTTILALLAFALSSVAAEVQTKVQYVSTTAVYLNAGRQAGIAQGDTVVISRDGKELIRLAVSFVAGNSSSCELVNAPTIVVKDDKAVVFVKEILKTEDSIAVQTYDAEVTPKTRSKFLRPTERPNQLSGRIGVGYTMQDDREQTNYDYTEPSLSVRASLSRVSGSDLSAKVNLKLRRTERENKDLSSSSNRIYEAMLVYEPQDKPLSAGAGRLMLRETRGMGYLDGAYVKYDLASNWKIGAVGGIEPDLQNTKIESDVKKYGAFAAFEKPLSSSSTIQTTASIAGRYLKDEISREFLYQQISFLGGSKFRLFESTEINLNRGWLKDAEGSTFTLASFLLDARYNFSRSLGFSLGYDNRTNYYTAETRSIPDSIFASSLQQGLRASIDTRFGDAFSAELGLASRDGESDFSSNTSGWVRVGSSNLIKSQVSAYARLRWFDSVYSKGTQPSLMISRFLTDWLDAGLEFGSNNYDLVATSESISQQWASAILDFSFAKQFYASTEYEQGFGDGRDATLLSLSLGYRF